MIARADAMRLPLASGIARTCITSPPYFSLRSYLPDDDPAKPLEVGGEDSVDAYVDRMVLVFREVKRCLTDDGTLFLNLGDGFVSHKPRGGSAHTSSNGCDQAAAFAAAQRAPDMRGKGGLKDKDLLGIPWAVAFALRADGWYLRAAAPWVKPACMPESVVDRPTSACEMVFLLSKRGDYFYDPDAVRVAGSKLTNHPAESVANKRPDRGFTGQPSRHHCGIDPAGRNRRTSDWWRESLPLAAAALREQADQLDRIAAKGGTLTDEEGLPLGFLVNNQNFRGGHFAVMPPGLITPAILAGTSAVGGCSGCGKPWVRVVERELDGWAYRQGDASEMTRGPMARLKADGSSASQFEKSRMGDGRATTKGWQPTCQCNLPSRPDLVLDPFAGSGTTLVVAESLGRRAFGSDLSHAYLRDFAARRLHRPHAPVIRPARDEPLPLFGEVSA